MARRATRIQQERAKGNFLLLLDAGNSLVGDQDPAKRSQGQTSVAVMNRMGYDAMALGPRDLTLGLAVLRQRVAEAEFALLSANAISADSGALIASPSLLREFDGHKIAIVGLSGAITTPEIITRDPLEAASATVAEVAAQADVIILLSHAGPRTDQKIAEAVPGIDLIVSGGDLTPVTPWRSEKTGTLVLHADQGSPGHAGRHLGIARLTFDAQGRLVQQTWQRLPLAPGISDDPDMATWVQQQIGP